MDIDIKNNIAVIYNPRAGQNRKKFLNQVLYLLESNNIEVSLFDTEYRGHAYELAKEIKENHEYKFIIAAGGDGTINEVINGIHGSDKILGIIPLGTVSVLAREIGLQLNPEAVADTIIKNNTKIIYPAIINGQCFSLMASVGIDAATVKNVNLALKKIVSKFAYLISFICEVLRSNHSFHIININEVEYKSYCTIIAKGKLYAGEYVCAPEASIHDQFVHAVMLKKRGIFGMIKFFWYISRNNISKMSDVKIIKAKKLSVFSDHREDIQIDGDYFGQLPVTINVSDKPLKIIVPAF